MTATDVDRPETVILGNANDAESLSEAILLAVAQEHDENVEDLDPIGEYVDPDALDDLFAPTAGSFPPVDGTLRFRYDDYSVTVDPDGVVLIRPA
jgi:hypothetical protein